MLALTSYQRRYLLSRAIRIHRDAAFGVRPMLVVCERHIPFVRLAIKKALDWPGDYPPGEQLRQERLTTASQRLHDARLEALAMIEGISDSLHLDQMALSSALMDGAFIPSELKLSPGQVEGPLASIVGALQAGLVDVSKAGTVPDRTIEQHRLLVTKMRDAGGTLLQYVSAAAWAAQTCREDTATPFMAEAASSPSARNIRTSTQGRIVQLPPDLDVPLRAAVANESSVPNVSRDDRAQDGDDVSRDLNGTLDVAAYFERRRRRVERGEQGPG
jgi:hypothetical protein